MYDVQGGYKSAQYSVYCGLMPGVGSNLCPPPSRPSAQGAGMGLYDDGVDLEHPDLDPNMMMSRRRVRLGEGGGEEEELQGVWRGQTWIPT